MKNLAFCILLFSLFSCNEQKPVQADVSYFDLKGYFEQEAIRLNKKNPEIRKEVRINGSVESKRIKIGNWEKEFSNFIDADINKKSWKGSFTTQKAGSLTVYKSSSDKIPVKKLSVEMANNQVKKLEIVMATKNLIYKSQDTLIYYPDSLYRIQKQQNIKLLKSRNYRISGSFQ